MPIKEASADKSFTSVGSTRTVRNYEDKRSTGLSTIHRFLSEKSSTASKPMFEKHGLSSDSLVENKSIVRSHSFSDVQTRTLKKQTDYSITNTPIVSRFFKPRTSVNQIYPVASINNKGQVNVR